MKKAKRAMKTIAWVLVLAMLMQVSLPEMYLVARADDADVPEVSADIDDADVNAAAKDEAEVEAEEPLSAETAFNEYNLYHAQSYVNGTGIKLNEKEQKLWEDLEKIGDGILRGDYDSVDGQSIEPEFAFLASTDEVSIRRACRLFGFAHPAYFFLDHVTNYKQTNGYAVTLVLREEYQNPAKLHARWEEIKAAAKPYLDGAAACKSDYEKAQYLYEQLTLNASYAYDENHKPSEEPEHHDIEGIFLQNKAVCEGFAKAYSMLLSNAGIQNVIGVGDKLSTPPNEEEDIAHVWNIVQLNGQTYLCDATWDCDCTDKAQWRYFLIGEDTDQAMPTKHLPATDEASSWYEDCHDLYEYAYSKTDHPKPDIQQAELLTMTLDCPADAGVKAEIWQGCMELPVAEDGSFSAYEGVELTLVAGYGERIVRAEINGTALDETLVFSPVDGATLKVSFEEEQFDHYGSFYGVTISENGAVGEAKAEIYTKSGRLIRDVAVSLVRDAVWAGIVKDGISVWYDKDAFSIDNYPVKNMQYNASVEMPDGVSASETERLVPNFGGDQKGKSFKLMLQNPDGGVIRAYKMQDGQMVEVQHLSRVPANEVIYLKAFNLKGETTADFFSRIGSADKKPIPSDTEGQVCLILAGDTTISANITASLAWKPSYSVTSHIKSNYEISPGTTKERLGTILPQYLTLCASVEGVQEDVPVTWNLDSYDVSLKDTYIDITGQAVLPADGHILAPGSADVLQVSTRLNIKAAPEVEEIVTEIPSEVTVPAGTPLDAKALGLPTTVTGHYQVDEGEDEIVDGQTIHHEELVDYYPSLEVVWTPDPATSTMQAAFRKKGYKCTKTKDVQVIFEDGFADSSAFPTNVTLTFEMADSEEAEHVATTQAPAIGRNTFYGKLSFKVPAGTDRRIELIVPRGFDDAAISNVTIHANVRDAGEAVDQSNKTTTLYVELDDEMPTGQEITVPFTFKSIFHKAYDRITEENYDDLGMIYPLDTLVPFVVHYQASVDGKVKKSCILDNAGLTVGSTVDKNKQNFLQRESKYDTIKINLEGSYVNQLTYIPIGTEIAKGSPYFVSITQEIPFPDIVKNASDGGGFSADAKRWTNTQTVNAELQTYGLYPDITLQDNVVSGTYVAAEPIRYIAYDNFGKQYTFNTNVYYTIVFDKTANSTLILSDDDTLYKPAGNKKAVTPYVVKPDGAGVYSCISEGPYTFYEDKGGNRSPGSAVYTVEVPDGVCFLQLQMYFGDSSQKGQPNKVTFEYYDGSEESFAYTDFSMVGSEVKKIIDLKSTDSKFAKGEQRIRRIRLNYNKITVNASKNSGKQYSCDIFGLSILAESYAEYADGRPVVYVDSRGNWVILTGKISVEAGGEYYEKELSYQLEDCSYESIAFSSDIDGEQKMTPYDINGNSSTRFNKVYHLQKVTGAGYLPGTDLRLQIAADPQMLSNGYIKLAGIKVKNAEPDMLIVTYTDGSTKQYGKEKYSTWTKIFEDIDKKTVEKIVLGWDSSANIKSGAQVELIWDVDWDKAAEENYGAKQISEDISIKISAKHHGDIYRNQKYMLVYEQDLYLTNQYLKHTGTSYANANASSLSVSEDFRRDEAIVHWSADKMHHTAAKLYASGERREHFDSVTIRLNAGKYIMPLNNERLRLTYELNGETICREPVKFVAVSTSANVFDVTFEDVYDGFTLDTPMTADVYGSETGAVTAAITDIVISDEQPYISNEMIKIKYAGKIDYRIFTNETGKSMAEIPILTPFSNRCFSYGRSETDIGKFTTLYRIVEGETAGVTAEGLTDENTAISQIVMYLPRKGETVNTPERAVIQNEIDLLFEEVLSDTKSSYVNYYSTDVENWVAFGTKTKPDGVDLTSIRAIKRVYSTPLKKGNKQLELKISASGDSEAWKNGYVQAECTFVSLQDQSERASNANLIAYRLVVAGEKDPNAPQDPSVSGNDPSVSNNDPERPESPKEPEKTPEKEPEKTPEKTPDKLPKDESNINPNTLEKRKDLSILLVKGKAKTQTSVTLTWLKEKKADGYDVFWSYCDGKNNYKKLATIKKNKKRTYTHKKLKKTREYKYFVASYRMVSGRKVYISKSPNVHVAMSFDKRTNVKSIKANKSKVTLFVKDKKYKKTFTIKAKMTLENKKKKALQHVRVLRYYTSDKSVAKVSSKGVITAKGKGKCTIYIIANNGAYKKIKVTVK